MMAVGERRKARVITASKDLQKRIGKGEIDENRVVRAQKVIDTNKVDFSPLARPHLDALIAALGAARKKEGQLDDSDLEGFTTPIMNLKANAATFNYPLISGLTGVVLTFLETHDNPGKKTLQVVDVLSKTLLLIVARQMTGDGGDTGRVLQTAFRDICRWCLEKERVLD